MEPQEVLQQMTEIFRKILDDPKIILTMDTTANDVKDWDSLNHLHLVVATEKHFKIKFTSSEIQNWKNVGEMCKTISERVK
jgi:acyl carrier protein